jgi:coatomer protein complex subunit gamma
VPKISREQAAAEVAQARPSALESIAASSSKTPEPVASTSTAAEVQSAFSAQLSAIPELASYGPVLKSSAKPIALTESETEYVVTLVKHVFKDHILFQFNVSNTIPDTVLEQVSVLMLPSEGCGLTEDFIIPVPALTSANGSGQVYVSFTREDPASYAAGSFGCTLRFVSKEVDPTSGEPEEEGYQDEYQVEDCDLGAGDVSGQRLSISVTVGALALIGTVHHADVCHILERVGQVGGRSVHDRDVCSVLSRISQRCVERAVCRSQM